MMGKHVLPGALCHRCGRAFVVMPDKRRRSDRAVIIREGSESCRATMHEQDFSVSIGEFGEILSFREAPTTPEEQDRG